MGDDHADPMAVPPSSGREVPQRERFRRGLGAVFPGVDPELGAGWQRAATRQIVPVDKFTVDFYTRVPWFLLLGRLATGSLLGEDRAWSTSSAAGLDKAVGTGPVQAGRVGQG